MSGRKSGKARRMGSSRKDKRSIGGRMMEMDTDALEAMEEESKSMSDESRPMVDKLLSTMERPGSDVGVEEGCSLSIRTAPHVTLSTSYDPYCSGQVNESYCSAENQSQLASQIPIPKTSQSEEVSLDSYFSDFTQSQASGAITPIEEVGAATVAKEYDAVQVELPAHKEESSSDTMGALFAKDMSQMEDHKVEKRKKIGSTRRNLRRADIQAHKREDEDGAEQERWSEDVEKAVTHGEEPELQNKTAYDMNRGETAACQNVEEPTVTEKMHTFPKINLPERQTESEKSLFHPQSAYNDDIQHNRQSHVMSETNLHADLDQSKGSIPEVDPHNHAELLKKQESIAGGQQFEGQPESSLQFLHTEQCALHEKEEHEVSHTEQKRRKIGSTRKGGRGLQTEVNREQEFGNLYEDIVGGCRSLEDVHGREDEGTQGEMIVDVVEDNSIEAPGKEVLVEDKEDYGIMGLNVIESKEMQEVREIHAKEDKETTDVEVTEENKAKEEKGKIGSQKDEREEEICVKEDVSEFEMLQKCTLTHKIIKEKEECDSYNNEDEETDVGLCGAEAVRKQKDQSLLRSSVCTKYGGVTLSETEAASSPLNLQALPHSPSSEQPQMLIPQAEISITPFLELTSSKDMDAEKGADHSVESQSYKSSDTDNRILPLSPFLAQNLQMVEEGEFFETVSDPIKKRRMGSTRRNKGGQGGKRENDRSQEVIRSSEAVEGVKEEDRVKVQLVRSEEDLAMEKEKEEYEKEKEAKDFTANFITSSELYGVTDLQTDELCIEGEGYSTEKQTEIIVESKVLETDESMVQMGQLTMVVKTEVTKGELVTDVDEERKNKDLSMTEEMKMGLKDNQSDSPESCRSKTREYKDSYSCTNDSSQNSQDSTAEGAATNTALSHSSETHKDNSQEQSSTFGKRRKMGSSRRGGKELHKDKETEKSRILGDMDGEEINEIQEDKKDGSLKSVEAQDRSTELTTELKKGVKVDTEIVKEEVELTTAKVNSGSNEKECHIEEDKQKGMETHFGVKESDLVPLEFSRTQGTEHSKDADICSFDSYQNISEDSIIAKFATKFPPSQDFLEHEDNFQGASSSVGKRRKMGSSRKGGKDWQKEHKPLAALAEESTNVKEGKDLATGINKELSPTRAEEDRGQWTREEGMEHESKMDKMTTTLSVEGGGTAAIAGQHEQPKLSPETRRRKMGSSRKSHGKKNLEWAEDKDMEQCPNTAFLHQKIQEAIKEKGFITLENMPDLISVLGLSLHELRQVFQQLDSNQDGRVTSQDFATGLIEFLDTQQLTSGVCREVNRQEQPHLSKTEDSGAFSLIQDYPGTLGQTASMGSALLETSLLTDPNILRQTRQYWQEGQTLWEYMEDGSMSNNWVGNRTNECEDVESPCYGEESEEAGLLNEDKGSKKMQTWNGDEECEDTKIQNEDQVKEETGSKHQEQKQIELLSMEKDNEEAGLLIRCQMREGLSKDVVAGSKGKDNEKTVLVKKKFNSEKTQTQDLNTEHTDNFVTKDVTKEVESLTKDQETKDEEPLSSLERHNEKAKSLWKDQVCEEEDSLSMDHESEGYASLSRDQEAKDDKSLSKNHKSEDADSTSKDHERQEEESLSKEKENQVVQSVTMKLETEELELVMNKKGEHAESEPDSLNNKPKEEELPSKDHESEDEDSMSEKTEGLNSVVSKHQVNAIVAQMSMEHEYKDHESLSKDEEAKDEASVNTDHETEEDKSLNEEQETKDEESVSKGQESEEYVFLSKNQETIYEKSLSMDKREDANSTRKDQERQEEESLSTDDEMQGVQSVNEHNKNTKKESLSKDTESQVVQSVTEDLETEDDKLLHEDHKSEEEESLRKSQETEELESVMNKKGEYAESEPEITDHKPKEEELPSKDHESEEEDSINENQKTEEMESMMSKEQDNLEAVSESMDRERQEDESLVKDVRRQDIDSVTMDLKTEELEIVMNKKEYAKPEPDRMDHETEDESLNEEHETKDEESVNKYHESGGKELPSKDQANVEDDLVCKDQETEGLESVMSEEQENLEDEPESMDPNRQEKESLIKDAKRQDIDSVSKDHEYKEEETLTAVLDKQEVQSVSKEHCSESLWKDQVCEEDESFNKDYDTEQLKSMMNKDKVNEEAKPMTEDYENEDRESMCKDQDIKELETVMRKDQVNTEAIPLSENHKNEEDKSLSKNEEMQEIQTVCTNHESEDEESLSKDHSSHVVQPEAKDHEAEVVESLSKDMKTKDEESTRKNHESEKKGLLRKDQASEEDHLMCKDQKTEGLESVINKEQVNLDAKQESKDHERQDEESLIKDERRQNIESVHKDHETEDEGTLRTVLERQEVQSLSKDHERQEEESLSKEDESQEIQSVTMDLETEELESGMNIKEKRAKTEPDSTDHEIKGNESLNEEQETEESVSKDHESEEKELLTKDQASEGDDSMCKDQKTEWLESIMSKEQENVEAELESMDHGRQNEESLFEDQKTKDEQSVTKEHENEEVKSLKEDHESEGLESVMSKDQVNAVAVQVSKDHEYKKEETLSNVLDTQEVQSWSKENEDEKTKSLWKGQVCEEEDSLSMDHESEGYALLSMDQEAKDDKSLSSDHKSEDANSTSKHHDRQEEESLCKNEKWQEVQSMTMDLDTEEMESVMSKEQENVETEPESMDHEIGEDELLNKEQETKDEESVSKDHESEEKEFPSKDNLSEEDDSVCKDQETEGLESVMSIDQVNAVVAQVNKEHEYKEHESLSKHEETKDEASVNKDQGMEELESLMSKEQDSLEAESKSTDHERQEEESLIKDERKQAIESVSKDHETEDEETLTVVLGRQEVQSVNKEKEDEKDQVCEEDESLNKVYDTEELKSMMNKDEENEEAEPMSEDHENEDRESMCKDRDIKKLESMMSNDQVNTEAVPVSKDHKNEEKSLGKDNNNHVVQPETKDLETEVVESLSKDTEIEDEESVRKDREREEKESSSKDHESEEKDSVNIKEKSESKNNDICEENKVMAYVVENDDNTINVLTRKRLKTSPERKLSESPQDEEYDLGMMKMDIKGKLMCRAPKIEMESVDVETEDLENEESMKGLTKTNERVDESVENPEIPNTPEAEVNDGQDSFWLGTSSSLHHSYRTYLSDGHEDLRGVGKCEYEHDPDTYARTTEDNEWIWCSELLDHRYLSDEKEGEMDELDILHIQGENRLRSLTQGIWSDGGNKVLEESDVFWQSWKEDRLGSENYINQGFAEDLSPILEESEVDSESDGDIKESTQDVTQIHEISYDEDQDGSIRPITGDEHEVKGKCIEENNFVLLESENTDRQGNRITVTELGGDNRESITRKSKREAKKAADVFSSLFEVSSPVSAEGKVKNTCLENVMEHPMEKLHDEGGDEVHSIVSGGDILRKGTGIQGSVIEEKLRNENQEDLSNYVKLDEKYPKNNCNETPRQQNISDDIDTLTEETPRVTSMKSIWVKRDLNQNDEVIQNRAEVETLSYTMVHETDTLTPSTDTSVTTEEAQNIQEVEFQINDSTINIEKSYYKEYVGDVLVCTEEAYGKTPKEEEHMEKTEIGKIKYECPDEDTQIPRVDRVQGVDKRILDIVYELKETCSDLKQTDELAEDPKEAKERGEVPEPESLSEGTSQPSEGEKPEERCVTRRETTTEQELKLVTFMENPNYQWEADWDNMDRREVEKHGLNEDNIEPEEKENEENTSSELLKNMLGIKKKKTQEALEISQASQCNEGQSERVDKVATECEKKREQRKEEGFLQSFQKGERGGAPQNNVPQSDNSRSEAEVIDEEYKGMTREEGMNMPCEEVVEGERVYSSVSASTSNQEEQNGLSALDFSSSAPQSKVRDLEQEHEQQKGENGSENDNMREVTRELKECGTTRRADWVSKMEDLVCTSGEELQGAFTGGLALLDENCEVTNDQKGDTNSKKLSSTCTHILEQVASDEKESFIVQVNQSPETHVTGLETETDDKHVEMADKTVWMRDGAQIEATDSEHLFQSFSVIGETGLNQKLGSNMDEHPEKQKEQKTERPEMFKVKSQVQTEFKGCGHIRVTQTKDADVENGASNFVKEIKREMSGPVEVSKKDWGRQSTKKSERAAGSPGKTHKELCEVERLRGEAVRLYEEVEQELRQEAMAEWEGDVKQQKGGGEEQTVGLGAAGGGGAFTLQDNGQHAVGCLPTGSWTPPVSGPDILYNVVLVGNSSVGKTSFMKRIQSGEFSLDHCATIGVDSCIQALHMDGRRVLLQLWDTAGQERYHSITKQILRKAQGLILMYDVTSTQSFHGVRYWMTCIREGTTDDVIIMLLGNKNDSAKREVAFHEGERLAKEYNIHFMECSAATGEHVTHSMENVARMLKQQMEEKEEPPLVLYKEQPKKTSGCC